MTHALRTTLLAATLLLSMGASGALAQAQEDDDGNGAATLQVREHPDLGRYVVDGQGMALYAFTNDEGQEGSACTGSCAENWPPLVSSGPAELGGAQAQNGMEDDGEDGEGAEAAIDEELVGTTERDDGTQQVTLGGWPLYGYVDDEEPGDVTGQGVGDAWYLVSPQGTLLMEEDAASEGDGEQAPEGEQDGAADEDDEGEAADDEAAGAEDDAAAQEGDGLSEDEIASLMEQGSEVYAANCAVCHGDNGQGGSLAPGLAGMGQLESAENTIAQVVHGGDEMPPFGGRLSDEEIAAVVTYIRESWGNDYGAVTVEEVVQAQ